MNNLRSRKSTSLPVKGFSQYILTGMRLPKKEYEYCFRSVSAKEEGTTKYSGRLERHRKPAISYVHI